MEALERARAAYGTGAYDDATIEYLFPEVKKSGDEWIRKWLIEMVEELRKANPTNAEHNGNCSEDIAYLEKQKEQKPAEWSEEDSKRYVSIRTTLETSAVLSKEDYDANVVWLRDLVNAKKYSGPKPSWKPSDEQMEALRRASTNEYVSAEQFDILVSLYEQLKKL
jgi:hypothetical protein